MAASPRFMTLRLPAPFLSRPTLPLPPFPALMLMLVTQADLLKFCSDADQDTHKPEELV